MDPASRDDMRPFTTVNYKQQRANKMKQRKIRQLMRTQENNSSDEIYPKFFTIRFPKLNIEKDVNLIAIDKDLKAKIGIPTMIKKQNKETLLVKVKSENQGNLLQQIQELAQQKVAVESHKSLNQSKGTVFSEALSNSTQEEILEALKNQHVLKVERLEAKIRGELRHPSICFHLQQARPPCLHQDHRLAPRTHQLIYPQTHALRKLSTFGSHS